MGVVWNGDGFLNTTRDDLAKRLERAAIFLENEIKKTLSDKSPPASDPGATPHLESGELRRSVTHEVDKENLVARVGTNKIYGRYLEAGTNVMEARPFLVPALEANQGALTEILRG